MLSIVRSRGRTAAVWCALWMALVEPAAALQTLPTPGSREWSCEGLGGCSIGPVAVSGSCRLTIRSTGIATAVVNVNGRPIFRVTGPGIRTGLFAGLAGLIRVRIEAAAQVRVEVALACRG